MLPLSYLAPSPTWRVSYRIAGIDAGRARLVGWGLFDNTLDEDLDQVKLTLISGRPISFRYDLAETRVPSRPQVSDDPNALEQATGDRGMATALSSLIHDLRTPMTAILGFADLLKRNMVGTLTSEQHEIVSAIRNSTQRLAEHMRTLTDLVRIRDSNDPTLPGQLYRGSPLGDLKVSSSYFFPVQAGNAEQQALTYRPSAPISVRRGQAALVPIIDVEVAYREQCVYNGSKMSNHPLLVWRFRNTTGVALEQGPMTVSAAGHYLGEGIVRFTGVEDELQVPYALEFGILVAEEQNYQEHYLRDVTFDATQRVAHVAWYHPQQTRYRLVSNVQREIEVLIEHRDPVRGEYVDMPNPAEQQDGHTRWSVVVPGRGTAELIVKERTVVMHGENVINWTASTVETLRAAGGLSDESYTKIQPLLQIQQEKSEAEAQGKAHAAELAAIAALQEQLRLNLKALGASEREAAIRNQLLDDLEASEARRRAIAAEQRAIEQQAQEREVRLQNALDALFA